MPPSPSRLFSEIATAERPAETTVIMRRAVVLGGSIAGLMAARVLSDHAEEVLIIERDPSEVDDGPRPGVPQGSQVHALLPAGQMQLERWFPGIADEAIALGAPTPPAEEGAAKIFLNGVLGLPPAPTDGGPALITTRPFLEALVRRRTLAVDNIRMVYGRAESLVFADQRVTGARYVPEGGAEPIVEPADLVVDAMGRSSRLSDWLSDNGWPRPPMQRMPIRLNYATALYKRDEKVSDTWVVVYHAMAGKGRTARIGGINSVEADRWIMLVAGYDDDRPSRDVADYAARCRDHYPPMFGDIAEHGEMLGGVVTYHQADSRRRDFHKLDRLPAGLVAAGDAVASFNPVYGQGMTSATLHASCLSAYLRSGPRPHEVPARAYFDQVKVIVDAAWQVSTTADIELPHVDGPYPRGYRITKWFGDLIFRTSQTDPVLSSRLNRVTTMLDHPATLSRPATLLRALRLGLFRGRPTPSSGGRA
ncbi:FAD-dependent oxidoreductase [Micromonospora sp. WMMD812]|uniref:FAD-dependent oxidoreductase n=1 Tax=Micromonospora sp. WMMD812 TaxID=3015152 RepID=UPI00248C7A23|nr:FAD-dependent oxidoreductase [Micromonospora sp. WMMD812]WBB65113.1 FAD-dependent oxidoreductase [Micromonospora sp. WMMD812]